jgi:hypothetical protein
MKYLHAEKDRSVRKKDARGFVKGTDGSLKTIIAASLCFFLIPPLYFIRLFSDARSLKRRVLQMQAELDELARRGEKPPLELAPPLSPGTGGPSSDLL